jgi:hypothetical protein
MSDITINPALNPLEVIMVEDWMKQNKPTVTAYTMTQGNDCIWVYWSYMNYYFIFRGGKIVDIQID